MHLRAHAIVCSVRAHAEHGAVVRALTPENGMQAGYVRGGRSRRLRPVLLAGNVIAAEWRARTDTQLAALTAELVTSRAPLLAEPLAAAAIEWVTALAATTLPEAHPYPRIHAALDGMLTAIESAPSARGWALGLARYEALLLAELGYAEESGGETIRDRLRCNRERLATDLLAGRPGDLLAARDRLIDRLSRALLD